MKIEEFSSQKSSCEKWPEKKVTKPLIFVGVIAGGHNSSTVSQKLMNGQIIGGNLPMIISKNVDCSVIHIHTLHTVTKLQILKKYY